MKRITLIAIAVLLLFIISIQSQTIPNTINYQGVLKDASGVIVANGNYNITFKLYDVETSGTALWTEIKAINVVDGIINTQLGNVSPITLPFDKSYWLGISIASESELTPRIILTSVPYSLMTKNIMNGSVTAEKIADNEIVKSLNGFKDNVNLVAGSNVTITPSSNNLTISTTGSSGLILPFAGELSTPDTKAINILHSASTGTNNGLYTVINSTLGSAVVGIVNSTTGATRSIFGENHSSTGYGVYGVTTNTSGVNYGIYGRSYSTDGFGVYGFASRTTGTNYGVYGVSSSSTGTGVYGLASDNSGAENYGVFGQANSPIGQGVRGVSPYIGLYGRAELTSGLNYGIFGRSLSTDGRGVHGTSPYIGIYGVSTSTLGLSYGVYGSSNYSGLFGIATPSSGTNYGVRGETNSVDGCGVLGKSPTYGVYGWATGTVFGYGIYGYCSGTGDAGYFSGRVEITGWLNKGGGSFRIDHPLDPANKYLNHSFVESPDMMNIYNGNVVTDAFGYSTITLPDWFEALNKDFRYQLTVIGEFANAIISQKVQNNQFIIRTDKPNVEVSWQVTGIRHDAFAEKNRMQIEELKKGDEIGKYLYPGAFGLSNEYGIDAQRNKKLQDDLKRTNTSEKGLNSTNIPEGDL